MATMEEALRELERRRAWALQMGGQERVARQHAKGRLTARERIDQLLDPGSFLETGMLAHSEHEEEEERTPANGMITGYGLIEGRPVAVFASDVTIKAGSGGRVGYEKSGRVWEVALEKGFPVIELSEGGGARMPDIMGSKGLPSFGTPIAQARRRRRIPMVTAALGDGYGATAWNAALSDLVVQVKGSCIALSGPRVLEVAIGEKITPEELGGWEVHTKITGLADLAVDGDEEALATIREFLGYLPSNGTQDPPVVPTGDDPARRGDELLRIVPDNPNRAYDMHRVIRSIVDNGKIFPIKPDFARSMITCLARMDGCTVGFIANNPMHNAGAMDADSCLKATRFLVMCDSFNIPVVFLHDQPGFLPGSKEERKNQAGKIIIFLEALGLSTVPKVAVVVRKSYGQAFFNMGGTNTGMDLLVAWPTADISFMSAEAGVNVVYGRQLAEAANPEEERQRLIEQWRLETAPWGAAGRGLVSAVIDPRDTRKVVIQGLAFGRNRRDATGNREQPIKWLSSWPTTW